MATYTHTQPRRFPGTTGWVAVLIALRVPAYHPELSYASAGFAALYLGIFLTSAAITATTHLMSQ
jgi:hypothetical protein